MSWSNLSPTWMMAPVSTLIPRPLGSLSQKSHRDQRASQWVPCSALTVPHSTSRAAGMTAPAGHQLVGLTLTASATFRAWGIHASVPRLLAPSLSLTCVLSLTWPRGVPCLGDLPCHTLLKVSSITFTERLSLSCPFSCCSTFAFEGADFQFVDGPQRAGTLLGSFMALTLGWTLVFGP